MEYSQAVLIFCVTFWGPEEIRCIASFSGRRTLCARTCVGRRQRYSFWVAMDSDLASRMQRVVA